MKKRTKEEINQDLERIQKCAEIACSLKEITEITALTEGKLAYTLCKNEEVKAIVKAKIKKNRMKRSKKIVLDTSVAGVNGIVDKIKTQLEQKRVFIITTIVNHELKNLSAIRDYPGKNANEIIKLALRYPDNFESASVEKFPWENANDAIIKFAKKKETVLWTSDKEMALNAKAFGIQTEYLRIQKHNIDVQDKHYNGRNTLFNTHMKNGKLYFDMNNCPKNRYSELIKDTYIYTSGVHELNFGDQVYVAKRTKGCIFIEHYKVVSISEKANVRLEYLFRIRRKKDINKIKSDYVVFARDAMYRFDVNKKIY